MRHPKFQLETYWDDYHQCYIKKATQESKGHLHEILKNHEIVEKEFGENKKIQIVKSQKKGELEIGFSKARGKNILQCKYDKKITAHEALDHIVLILNTLKPKTNTESQHIYTMFGEYGRRIYDKEDYVAGILDITASNVFRDTKENTYTLIDQERYCNDPVPRKLLIFRAINVMRWRGAVNGKHYISLCERYGIKKRHIPFMKIQERYFQCYVGYDKDPSMIYFLKELFNTYADKL